MSTAFTHLTLGASPEATPDEILTATEQLLQAAAARGEATLVVLDAHCSQGWHPVLGRFQLAARRPDAPDHLPAWLATLPEARHVHAGGDSSETAIAALLALFRSSLG